MTLMKFIILPRILEDGSEELRSTGSRLVRSGKPETLLSVSNLRHALISEIKTTQSRMLQPILNSLNARNIILASTSPRRKGLLEKIGLKFDIIPSKFEEDLNKSDFSSPLEYVRETAKQKTLEVVGRLYNQQTPPPDLIIGADTIVTMEGKIFEKPASRDNAISILTGFSGGSHTVITSVVLVTPNQTGSGDCNYKLVQFHECTDVQFATLDRPTIEAYVDTGEPMDKAGGYGIQGVGSTLIRGVKGDYFNVIGFPLHQFCVEMLKLFPKA